MRIAFLLDWELKEGSQLATAEDGMWEAIRLLGKKHEVRCHIIGPDSSIFPHQYFPIYMQPTPEAMANAIADWEPDAALVWADFSRPTIPLLVAKGIPTTVAFSGGIGCGSPVPGVKHYFVESQSYYDKFKEWDLPVSFAFGVNDRIFKEIKQPKIFDCIFPATFASWKRHTLYAQATQGLVSLACGYMYTDHETDCWGIPQDLGIGITHHIPGRSVADFINMSKTVVVTSNTHGGSQRTVLEAMACGVPVIVMSDSDKTTEYVRESGAGIITDPNPAAIREAIKMVTEDKVQLASGRDYINNKWTAQHYADALEAGLIEAML